MSDIQHATASSVTVRPNRVNIYNIVPPVYSSFDEMIGDLKRIQEMGFNAVWLNPFLEVGQGFFQRSIEGEYGIYWVQSCLYASTYDGYSVSENGQQHYHLLNLQDPANKFSERGEDGIAANERAIQQVQQFTTIAHEHGITPMFDLVLNHVAIDSPLYLQREWFLKDQPDQMFNDVIGFKYETYANSENNKKIFDIFWKNVIDFYIDTLGFRGVRVDCVSYTNPYIMDMALQYIKSKLETKYKIKNPIIFGELIGKKETQPTFSQIKAMRDMKVTGHAIPFSHLMLSTNELPPVSYADIGIDVNVNVEALTKLLLMQTSAEFGGLIGAAGTHDRLPLYPSCKKIFDETHEKFAGDEHAELFRMMKEKILMTVIGSNGGWYLMSGDEFADPLIKQPPFLYKGERVIYGQPANAAAMTYRYEGRTTPRVLLEKTHFNLQAFIRSANQMASEIEYSHDSPLCCFYKHATNIFIAVGNFNYRGKNYLAIDLNKEPLGLDDVAISKEDIAIYQRRFSSYLETFYRNIGSSLFVSSAALQQSPAGQTMRFSLPPSDSLGSLVMSTGNVGIASVIVEVPKNKSTCILM